MPAYRIDRLLAADAGLQPALDKALSIRALQRSLLDFLPPEIARGVRGVSLREGRLVLLCANSAAAAKAKLLTESLCKFLLGQGTKVNGVSVRVQPATATGTVAPQKREKLPAAAIAALQDLHRKLADSPAREALKNLLDHQLKPAPAGPGPRPRAAPPRRARK